MPLADMLLASVFKTYSGFSSRRFTTDVQAVMRDGLIDSSPHFNSTNRYIADPDLTPLLKSLIEVSASPWVPLSPILRQTPLVSRHPLTLVGTTINGVKSGNVRHG